MATAESTVSFYRLSPTPIISTWNVASDYVFRQRVCPTHDAKISLWFGSAFLVMSPGEKGGVKRILRPLSVVSDRLSYGPFPVPAIALGCQFYTV